jgi:hypothetical protein
MALFLYRELRWGRQAAALSLDFGGPIALPELKTPSQINPFCWSIVSFNGKWKNTGNEQQRDAAMSEKRYIVMFTGKTKPGVDTETVKSNLVLSLGLSDAKAAALLQAGRKLLKRCATSVEAQVLAEKFDQAGILCEVRDAGMGEANMAVQTGGESSLVRVLKSFSSSPEKESNPSLLTRLIKPGTRRKRA